MANSKSAKTVHALSSGCGMPTRNFNSTTFERKQPAKTATRKAKKYASFLVEHVKKGEMPWTQWYCCHVVDGFEVC